MFQKAFDRNIFFFMTDPSPVLAGLSEFAVRKEVALDSTFPEDA
jgi:hypothetical protein